MLGESGPRQDLIATGVACGAHQITLHVGHKADEGNGARVGIGLEGADQIERGDRTVVQIEDHSLRLKLSNFLEGRGRRRSLDGDADLLCGLLNLRQEKQVFDHCHDCTCHYRPFRLFRNCTRFNLPAVAQVDVVAGSLPRQMAA